MNAISLLQQLSPSLPPSERATLQQKLEACINQLINHDFSALVQLLYRVDVSEQKLKTLLKQHADKDAAPVIAALLIERQLQKTVAKKGVNAQPPPDDAERW